MYTIRTALLISLAGLAVQGCAKTPTKAAAEPVDAPSAGLETLGGEGQLTLLSTIDPDAPITDSQRTALAEQAAADLESFLNRREAPEPTGSGLESLAPIGAEIHAEPAATQTASAPAPEPAPIAPAEADDRILQAAAQAWAAEPPKLTGGDNRPTPSIAQRPPEDPVQGLAMKMAALLREPEGKRISDPVALASIEALQPGVIADLESPGNTLGEKLSAEDRATLLAARSRVLAEPSAANEALVKSLARVAKTAPMRIAKAAICTRVQGFGRYDPFPSDTFLAGRPARLIVYAELDGFSYRPANDADPLPRGTSTEGQFTAELSQSLTLYHDPSGLQAWHKPAQRVVETTRGKRRDFYLIHQVELPATLTIGRYYLKVTVTDKTTGATDEANIPINVVADPSLTTRR